MKKIVLISIFSVAICVVAMAVVYDESNFSANGRMFQPAPDGQIAGSDNAPGHGINRLLYCLRQWHCGIVAQGVTRLRAKSILPGPKRHNRGPAIVSTA